MMLTHSLAWLGLPLNAETFSIILHPQSTLHASHIHQYYHVTMVTYDVMLRL